MRLYLLFFLASNEVFGLVIHNSSANETSRAIDILSPANQTTKAVEVPSPRNQSSKATDGPSESALTTAANATVSFGIQNYSEQRVATAEDNVDDWLASHTCVKFHKGGEDADQEDPEIVIGVLTNRKNHYLARSQLAWYHEKFRQMRKNGDKFSIRVVYFTNQAMSSMENWWEYDPASSFESAQNRFLLAIRFMSMDCAGYNKKLNWFMLIDDDTLVDPSRLLTLLSTVRQRMDPMRSAVILGRDSKWTWDSTASLFGGNGILFSRGAMDILGHAPQSDWLDALKGTQKYKDPKLGQYYEYRMHTLIDTLADPKLQVIGFQSMFGVGFDLDVQDEVRSIKKFFDVGSKSVHWKRLHLEIASWNGAPDVAVTLHKVKTAEDYAIADSVFNQYKPQAKDFYARLFE